MFNANSKLDVFTKWLKLKPYIEVSLSIVAVEEGTGRNEGKLGALVCEGIDNGNDVNEMIRRREYD